MLTKQVDIQVRFVASAAPAKAHLLARSDASDALQSPLHGGCRAEPGLLHAGRPLPLGPLLRLRAEGRRPLGPASADLAPPPGQVPGENGVRCPVRGEILRDRPVTDEVGELVALSRSVAARRLGGPERTRRHHRLRPLRLHPRPPRSTSRQHRHLRRGGPAARDPREPAHRRRTPRRCVLEGSSSAIAPPRPALRRCTAGLASAGRLVQASAWRRNPARVRSSAARNCSMSSCPSNSSTISCTKGKSSASSSRHVAAKRPRNSSRPTAPSRTS